MFDSSSSHIDFQSSQTKNTNNTHTFTYLPPFKKPRVDYSATKNSIRENMMGCDYQKPRTVNFSNFSIPTVFLKSTHHQQNSSKIISSERVQESQHGFTKFQQQKHVKLVHETNTTELLPPVDEHSETAASHNSAYGIRKKRKANDINLCNQRESSFVCSLEASNDPNFGFRKLREETDDSPYFSDNEEEMPEKLDREDKRVKRSYRNAKNHNLSERKRRDKINEKMHTLKELIPNCNKMDKASMLDDAIDYLKTLKLQLQIMSMARGLCMPFNNVMMFPAHHMNMNAQHLMSLRPPQVQFPIPQPSNNGVTENNRVQMFGFSNQFPVVPPSMSIPNAPYMPPIIGNNSTIPLPTSFGGNQDQHGRTCG